VDAAPTGEAGLPERDIRANGPLRPSTTSDVGPKTPLAQDVWPAAGDQTEYDLVRWDDEQYWIRRGQTARCLALAARTEPRPSINPRRSSTRGSPSSKSDGTPTARAVKK